MIYRYPTPERGFVRTMDATRFNAIAKTITGNRQTVAVDRGGRGGGKTPPGFGGEPGRKATIRRSDRLDPPHSADLAERCASQANHGVPVPDIGSVVAEIDAELHTTSVPLYEAASDG
jgi:hypothetical protein